MKVFFKCFNSNYLGVRLHKPPSKSFALQEAKKRREEDCSAYLSLQHSTHHRPGCLAKDRCKIKTANKTSCCHWSLPGHLHNKLWQGLAPLPGLAVLWRWWTTPQQKAFILLLFTSLLQPLLPCSPGKSSSCPPDT